MASLVTVEDYQAAIGTELDGIAYSQAEAALKAASDAVRRHCSQTFDLVLNDEIALDGTGTASLILPELPVVQINSVTVTDWSGVETPLYSLSRHGGILRRTGWKIWPAGFGNVTVDYDHGYGVIVSDESSDGEIPAVVATVVPDDLKKVIIQLAQNMVTNIGRDVALQSKTVGPFSESYFQNAMVGVDLGAYDNILELYIAKQVPVP